MYVYGFTLQIVVKLTNEIQADVEGYKGNPSYSIFYAVFYAENSVCLSPKVKLHVGRKAFPGKLERYLCSGQMNPVIH